MIADCDTNVVFVADTLECRFPGVYRGLASILGQHAIPLRTIPGAKDIWCRDYMPIQVAEDRFVQFRYAPDCLAGKYRHLRADGEIGPTIPQTKRCLRSEVVLDGGNVIGAKDRVILCDKVFRENPGWRRPDLLRELGRILGVGRVTVIPTEPGDVMDHSDGVVRFATQTTVLVNDYRSVDRWYCQALEAVLSRASMSFIRVPYRPQARRAAGIPSAEGCYLNYLQIRHLLIMPKFGRAEDKEVATLFRALFPECHIVGLECADLAVQGGAIHCVTWNISSGCAVMPTVGASMGVV